MWKLVVYMGATLYPLRYRADLGAKVRFVYRPRRCWASDSHDESTSFKIVFLRGSMRSSISLHVGPILGNTYPYSHDESISFKRVFLCGSMRSSISLHIGPILGNNYPFANLPSIHQCTPPVCPTCTVYYNDVIMGAIASQITSLTIVYSTVYSDVDQRKHQSSASLAFVRGIHRGPVNSPHKWPVTRKMFPFDDVIMVSNQLQSLTWLRWGDKEIGIHYPFQYFTHIFSAIFVELDTTLYSSIMFHFLFSVLRYNLRLRFNYFWTDVMNHKS